MKKFLYDIFAEKWLNGCDSIWVISDPHFSDTESYKLRGLLNVLGDLIFAKEQGESRPYDLYIEERLKVLDEMQIKNINSKAGKNSCLIILGDVGNLECVKRLKAKRKILIMGNHDKGASNYKKEYWFTMNDGSPLHFEDKSTEKRVISGDLNIINVKTCNNGLFDEVYEGPLMINDRVILSHEPITVPEYMFNIHGHVHEADYKCDEYHLNCCAEVIDYSPINLLDLIKKGLLKDIENIHRKTIDFATENKKSKEN